MNATIRKVWNVATTVLVAAVVVLALLLAGVRLVGLKPFAVLSGSMEPAYRVGSLIYVKDAQAADIEVGDPITFVLNEELVVATHRVIRVDAENQLLYTKGDANQAADAAPVHFKNLIGMPVFTIPWLGYIAGFLNTTSGTIVAITVAALLLLLVFVPDMIKKVGEAEERDNAVNTRKSVRRYKP